MQTAYVMRPALASPLVRSHPEIMSVLGSRAGTAVALEPLTEWQSIFRRIAGKFQRHPCCAVKLCGLRRRRRSAAIQSPRVHSLLSSQRSC